MDTNDKGYDRRGFLKLVGLLSGSVTVGALTPAVALAKLQGPSAMSFRAVAGLPSAPWPAYASLVLEGSVNLATRSGVVNRTVFAGAPDVMSDIALPGMSQTIRVMDVRASPGLVRIQGVVSDRSQLQAGENANIEILVDQVRGIVRAPFSTSNVALIIQR
jgi:hypothetical protein